MIKYLKSTEIYDTRNSKSHCPIFTHEGKFYVKVTKSKRNLSQVHPFYYEGNEYAEVECILDYWYVK